MISLPANKSVYLIGAGGHARSVYGLLSSLNFQVEGFYDDNFIAGELIGKAKALGNLSAIDSNHALLLAIGDNRLRKLAFEKFKSQIIKENIFHSSSILMEDVQMENSNLIFSRTVVNSFAKIGSNNIINTGSIIEHEVEIGSHNHISVNAVLAGRVKVGNGCFIGAGSVIKDEITICDNCIIGAGSVVLKNISEKGTYVGVPAKRIK